MRTDVPTRLAAAAHPEFVQFLLDRGAGTIAHPGGHLFAHLLRVATRLAEWEALDSVIAAGLGHAAYGTDGFAVSLAGLDERNVVKQLIGAESEQLVYLYAAADRSVTWNAVTDDQVHYRDRFTGASRRLTTREEHGYWTVTAANELDLFGRMAGAEEVLPLLASRSAALPPKAQDSITMLATGATSQ